MIPSQPVPAARGERRSTTARDPGNAEAAPQFAAALAGARRQFALRRSGQAQESEPASPEAQNAPAALVFAAAAAPEMQLAAAATAGAGEPTGVPATAAPDAAVFARAVELPQGTAGMGMTEDAALDGAEGQPQAAGFPSALESQAAELTPEAAPQVKMPDANGGQENAPAVERPVIETPAAAASPAPESAAAPAAERFAVQQSAQAVEMEAVIKPAGPDADEAQIQPAEARQGASQDASVRGPAGLEQPVMDPFFVNAAGQGLEVIAPESAQPVDFTEAFGPWLAKLQRSGKSSLELRLHPQELGEIQVLLKSTREGASVVIRVEQAAAGSLLEQNLGDLRRSLAEAGVQVTEIQVEQGPAQFDARAGSQERSPGGRPSWRLNVPSGAQIAEPVYNLPQALRSSPGLVEYLI